MNFSSQTRKRPRGMVARFYHRLLESWGPQNWWPAESKFEVLAGAILTQNTSWKNVERALANLRAAGALSLAGIIKLDEAELQTLLRPAGYFRQKSRRLKDLAEYIQANYSPGRCPAGAERSQAKADPQLPPEPRQRGGGCDPLQSMLAEPTEKLRGELLRQKGVGPETADSILLYAGDHPVFVVDAYTRRIFERHKLLPSGAGYEEIRQLVEQELRKLPRQNPRRPPKPVTAMSGPPTHPASAVAGSARNQLAQRYNEFHALLVQVGKHYCLKAAPRCEGCPLAEFL
jgi:endonuclease-3 related protein